MHVNFRNSCTLFEFDSQELCKFKQLEGDGSLLFRCARMSSKAALVVPALKRHTSTVIVAHGLGDR